MHAISNTKIDFLRFWLSTFFCWKNPGRGSIRKYGKLTGHVCFVNRALFILIESTKNDVLNTMNQPVVLTAALTDAEYDIYLSNILH